MKNKLLAAILFVACKTITAQTYFPLPDTNTIWSVDINKIIVKPFRSQQNLWKQECNIGKKFIRPNNPMR